jgi:hypothetical protein
VIATSERFENFIDNNDDGFSEIELRVLDLERDVSEWRAARTRGVASPARRRPREHGAAGSGYRREPEPDLAEAGYEPDFAEGDFAEPESGREDEEAETWWEDDDAEDDRLQPVDRTQELISRGRQTARPGAVRRVATRPASRRQAARPIPARPAARPIPARPAPAREKTAPRKTAPRKAAGRKTTRRARSGHGRTIAVGSVVLVAILGIGALILLRPGPSWPASVARVRNEITAACQNPNVAAEPSQVNFACDKDTSQILWVFSLLTSSNDPGYADAKTGRKGLEPITAAQGGEIAWSLNLHHPYNPLSPVDSLEVAARAINNIIGGATLTSTSGTPAVQPGLESKPENCARYTGSSALVSHAGFPSRCASPVTSAEGQAALVADVYQQWMPGAGAVAAQNASVLFQNAGHPGNPQVQAILKNLPHGN